VVAKAQPATQSPGNSPATAAAEPQRSSDARPMAGQPSGGGSAELAGAQLDEEAAAELVGVADMPADDTACPQGQSRVQSCGNTPRGQQCCLELPTCAWQQLRARDPGRPRCH
jgi:hypothetical protein